jgi:Mg-chelatase subunit ChlD
MNNNSDPQTDPRQEFEAKVTALLLGELPEAEAVELRQRIAQDPNLAKIHGRLQATIQLVKETVANPEEQAEAQPATLKLSEDRRQKLLAHFKTIKPKEIAEAPSRQRSSWLVPMAAAAAVVILLIPLALPNFSRARLASQRSTIANNLRQLDGAKQQWALENHKSGNDVATLDDLKPYMRGGPPSLAGETYVVGKVSEPVQAELSASKAKKVLGRLPAGQVPSGSIGQRVRLSMDGELRYADQGVNSSLGSGPAVMTVAGAAQPVGQFAFTAGGLDRTRELSQLPMGSAIQAPALNRTPIVLPAAGERRKTELALNDSKQPPGAFPSSAGQGFFVPAPVAAEKPPGDLKFGTWSIDKAGTQNMEVAQKEPRSDGSAQPSMPAPGTSSGTTWSSQTAAAPAQQRIEDGNGFSIAGGGGGIGGGAPVAATPPPASMPPPPVAAAPTTIVLPAAAPEMASAPAISSDSLTAEPKVELKAKFDDASEGDSKKLGFNWKLGDELAENQPAGQAGIAENEKLAEQTTPKLTLNGATTQSGEKKVLKEVPLLADVPAQGSLFTSEDKDLQNRDSGKSTLTVQNRGVMTWSGVISGVESVTNSLDMATPESLAATPQTPPTPMPVAPATGLPLPNPNAGSASGWASSIDHAPQTAAVVPGSPPPLATNMVALNGGVGTYALNSSDSADVAAKLNDLFSKGSKSQTSVQTRSYKAEPEKIQELASLQQRQSQREAIALPESDNKNSNTPVYSVSIVGYSNVPTNGTPLQINPFDSAEQQKNSASTQGAVDTLSGKQLADARVVERPLRNELLPKTSMAVIVDRAEPPPEPGILRKALGGKVESTARVKVERDQSDIAGLQAPEAYDPHFIQTESEVMQSEAVLGKVADSLKLDESWARKQNRSKLTKEETIAVLKKNLDLRPVKKTDLLEIRYKSTDPDEAAKVANAIAEAYRDHRVEQRQQLAIAGAEALEQRSLSETQKTATDRIAPGMVDFRAVDISQALALYGELANRRVLRPDTLPSGTISAKSLQSDKPLTKQEALQMLDKELAKNGIAMINIDQTHLKAVPITQANQEGAPFKPQDVAPARPATPPPIPQPEILTRENAFSTFSLNVSDVSFKLAQASLEKGVLPEVATIRSEEFINAFDYRDPEPGPGSPMGFAWERARYPFAQNRDLLRFAVKTAAQGRQAGRPLNLVLLLDNSGSMERADRVRIIHEALRVLAGQLQPQDTFSVVTFARTARLFADGVPGNQASKVAEDVSALTPEGGTNLEDAMNLAYQTALRHYLANGINRVVLLTDGAANLGNVEPESLKKKVEANRKQGIALDCFGIGWEDYNDDLLEVLSRNGGGRYGFINTPEEAATGFAGQLAGALQVAAADVKVQVEFNPNRVTSYRQLGYAKHQLKKEEFRDNTVAAAQIGAAESGNALYMVEINPKGDGPLGTVHVRYRIPGTTDYREQEWTVPYTGTAVLFEQASPAMRLAGTASAFSEWLAASPYATEVTPDRLLGYLRGVPEVYGVDTRPKKLEWMIRQAQSLGGSQTPDTTTQKSPEKSAKSEN